MSHGCEHEPDSLPAAFCMITQHCWTSAPTSTSLLHPIFLLSKVEQVLHSSVQLRYAIKNKAMYSSNGGPGPRARGLGGVCMLSEQYRGIKKV